MKPPFILKSSFIHLNEQLMTNHKILLSDINATAISTTVDEEAKQFLPSHVKNHTERLSLITTGLLTQLARVIQHIHKQKIPGTEYLGATPNRTHNKYKIHPVFIRRVIRDKYTPPTPKYYLKCTLCLIHQQEEKSRILRKIKK
jgi:hypothetical protein